MAVQAHYSHRQPLFLARGGAPESSSRAATDLPQAHKEMTTTQHPPLFLDFSHGDGDGGNGRKRPHDAEAAVVPRLFSLQPQASAGHKVISLAQLHKRPATGLRLDFDEGSEHVSSTSSASSLLSDELAAQCDQYNNDMDRLLQEHAERLRRALAEVRRRHYRSLLGAAEAAAAAARRVREKEAEVSKAARRGAELEERLARLRAEAAAWQAKAVADQSTAAALHAQLQQAAAAVRGKAEKEDNAADDAESGFVDPDRVEEVAPPAARPCRTCRHRASSIVLLPCRHLCMCDACEPAVSTSIAGTAAAACPMCRGAVTGTVQVVFS